MEALYGKISMRSYFKIQLSIKSYSSQGLSLVKCEAFVLCKRDVFIATAYATRQDIKTTNYTVVACAEVTPVTRITRAKYRVCLNLVLSSTAYTTRQRYKDC